ncbi:uncharacterized protein LOC132746863 [Ruditapes philippinarum]|uniref:uncharacterized protein LOC132746863 n=1 Tax=Ruditapes philippinarum TaxID=129788 RepID=UPI00295A8122|nr:uncharacterized protein LOC132746863 [Ruditapes philippinarum]
MCCARDREQYLEPIELTEEEKKNIAKSLIDLRNNIALGMAMINLLWIAINFMFQLQSPTTIPLPFSGSSDNPESPEYLEENQKDTDMSASDPTISLKVGVTAKRSNVDSDKAREFIEKIIADCSDDNEDDDDEKETKNELQVLQRTGSRYRVTETKNGLSATSRRLDDTMPDIGRSQSVRIITDSIDGLQATKREHPKSDELRLNLQHEARRATDENIKEPPPTVKRRRLNLEAGRSELASRLQEINPSTMKFFLDVPQNKQRDEGDEIYEQIGSKGKVGRQLSKGLRHFLAQRKNPDDTGRANGTMEHRVDLPEDQNQCSIEETT